MNTPKKEITVSYLHYADDSQLPEFWKDLLDSAISAAEKAYAPYSNFKVGCSLSIDGKYIEGCNQENVAYPSGLCAERVAVYAAGMGEFKDRVDGMAIVAFDSTGKMHPAFSCGACRQSMIEFEQRAGQAVPVLMSAGKGEYYQIDSISHLLPFFFSFEK